MMMDGQRWATPQRGLPVEDTGGSSARLAVTGETAAFYYSNSGTRTADAGQAAGTVVMATLAYSPIANSSGTEVATYLNSSLTFTSTAFTSEVKLSWQDLESLDGLGFAERLSRVQTLVAGVKTAQANNVTTSMANGDYVVDYRKGAIYGKKASTQTSLTSVAYTALTKAIATGSGSLASQVQGNIAAGSTDSGNPVKTGGKYNASAPTLSDGQRGDTQFDINANTKTRETYAPGYEDNTNNKAVVEHRYTATRMTADTSVKSGAGFVHTVSIGATGAVTAGAVTLYDNTAESGTILWSGIVQVTTAPITILLDCTTTTGIYVGYDGTIANVATTVTWR